MAIELLKKGVRNETKRHKALVNSKKAAWKERQEVSAEAPPVCWGHGHTKILDKKVVPTELGSKAAWFAHLRDCRVGSVPVD